MIPSLSLLHLIFHAWTVVAPAAVPVETSEATVLESSGIFDSDDTSLLQLGFKIPAASSRGDPAQSRVDIPEASFAWSLFQEVRPGTPAPWNLVNESSLEPPGYEDLNMMASLKAVVQNGRQTYFAPRPISDDAPAWMSACATEGSRITKYKSWNVELVPEPQLVPFVVPMDHPNRTDVSVIVAPGGGGTLLAWETSGTDVAKWLNLLGISAFVLKYRVPAPEVWNNSDAIFDAQRAVSLVKHMAPALGLNASRVGLFGASHGGWIASFTAFAAGRQYPRRDVVDDQSPRPDFLLLLYPEVRAPAFARRAASPLPVETVDGVALTDLRESPPIFIATGARDPCVTVDTIYSFHSSLKKRSDAIVEINVYSDVQHGFTMCYRYAMTGFTAMQHEACLWMLRARRFIMWNVERRIPADIEYWYRQTVQFDTTLLAVNSSGMR
mmetsp:Transcript_48882/g.141597  ORF Transcript_48882/g.141597 Transcript_48882/m.141597 type:complete len:440 (+) Transcript_48882:82-1401(+)